MSLVRTGGSCAAGVAVGCVAHRWQPARTLAMICMELNTLCRHYDVHHNEMSFSEDENKDTAVLK